MPIHEDGPLTGKPDAGNPPVRFGGRGGRNQSAFPTPIETTIKYPREFYAAKMQYYASSIAATSPSTLYVCACIVGSNPISRSVLVVTGPMLAIFTPASFVLTVSYTHLRAHETGR